jgi:CRP/FNR family transcriptional regulator, cyclic AMP receptor protein
LAGDWWPEARAGDLVRYLSDDEHRRLFTAMEAATAAPGDVILSKGSPARTLLLLEEGELEVVEESGGDPVVLASLGPGSVVGEVGFVDGRPRTHTVRAVGACRLRRLSRDRLLLLVKDDPALFAKLTIALAELLAFRFRSAVDQIERVRSFTSSLSESDERPATFDEVDGPLSEDVVEFLKDMARKAQTDATGI